jgi:hypothetical protein
MTRVGFWISTLLPRRFGSRGVLSSAPFREAHTSRGLPIFWTLGLANLHWNLTFDRLGVSSRVQLILYALSHNQSVGSRPPESNWDEAGSKKSA